ncbi:hypothetical protein TMatcc_010540 [Talaromyces marneffei ATCC 18224]
MVREREVPGIHPFSAKHTTLIVINNLSAAGSIMVPTTIGPTVCTALNCPVETWNLLTESN